MAEKSLSTGLSIVQPLDSSQNELAMVLRSLRRAAAMAKRQGGAGRNLIVLELRNLRKAVRS